MDTRDVQHSPYMRLIILSLALLLCTTVALSLPGCRRSNRVEKTKIERLSSSPEAREVYDNLLKATSFGEPLLYADNLTGRIVWNQAQFMESLLNMYELTHDRNYLELFIRHADHVLKMRDDRAKRPDYAGRLRPGWQTGGYYTLGVPIIIPDEQGKPALEVQGIHRSGNDHTVIEIVWGENDHFTLIVRNDFRRATPLEVKFDGLTMENAEAVVNKDLSPNSWIRITVLSASLPQQGVYPLTETYRMVLHELHTPIIGVPFLRFADLVFREPELHAYQPLAQEYIQAFEESFQDYRSSWREDEVGGYFVFEPGGKFWASGLPVPYNGLSANGIFLLYLWRLTGKVEYLEKAAALARKIRAGITFRSDGTMTMPYWVKDSLPYTGWDGLSAAPVNGLYARCKPDPATEDVSHFSLTLRFMVEAWQEGLIFQDNDLKAVARTFSAKIWKPSRAKADELCDPNWQKGFYLARDLDGKGQAYDYAIATFALLTPWEPSISDRGLEVYSSRYKDIRCIDIDYLYGEIMLGWSILALRAHDLQ